MAARRSAARLAALFFSSFFVPAFASLADASGIWQGTLERDGAPLEIELAFVERDGRLEGSFSAAQLRAVRIPLSEIVNDPPNLRWHLKGDTTTMIADATIVDDTLAGTFTEGKAAGTFRLRRAAATRFPAREEEITFEGADGAVLSGTVHWPHGDGPFPGVVFLHGSGAEGRWATRYLAHEFARAGIAALAFDKRGVGASKGDWRTTGFEALVKDASAAVDALRARPRIDKARVGIHGHSQGGTYAPWVAASNPSVAFVVASAASGVRMGEAEMYSIGNAMRIAALPPEERRLAERFLRALVAHAYDGGPRSELDAIRREAEGKSWLIPVPADASPYWTFSRRIAAYDPLRYWREVRVPALLVYGARDERVPPQESAARIVAAAAVKPDVIMFPDADHGFRMKPRTAAFAWPESAPGYPARVIEWVVGVTRKAAR